MEIYEVGGAVRDSLLGLPVQDRDWVVVGGTPGELLALGYRAVGKDFPVFLHPQTHEEYALARTERKTGPGYRGFEIHTDPGVTLEQDLMRRDLTINALARDARGRIIDPWGGQADLADRRLRHVSPAFVEDPVRLLRIARFAARFKEPFGFTIAPETQELMTVMVARGEVDHLVPERVIQEFRRGLETPHPAEMFEVLARCQALPRFFAGIETVWASLGRVSQGALEASARRGLPGRVRWGCWLAPLAIGMGAPGIEILRTWLDTLRFSQEERDAIQNTCQWGPALAQMTGETAPHTLLEIFERVDLWRRPQRFRDLLDTQSVLATVQGQPLGLADAAWHRLADALMAVDAATIAQRASAPGDIPALIRTERLGVLADCLATFNGL